MCLRLVEGVGNGILVDVGAGEGLCDGWCTRRS